MFQQARLKLTGWYLLILSTIVILFSLTIYRLVNLELVRIAKAQRSRIERWQVILPPQASLPPLIMIDEAEIIELRQRLWLMLVGVDVVIIVVAGGMSYLLAGKTLTPIEKMVEDQVRFVTDSSHELRTPLTALRTSIEVALRDKALNTSAAEEVLQANLKEVIRLQQLAESLLELTRSGQKMSLQPTNVELVVKKSVAQTQNLADAKKILVEVNTPRHRVVANQLALERVLIIVLDNAIKYSEPKTTIAITSQQKQNKVWIVVSDQGQGIASEQIGRVFERFYRADAARSSKVAGYGLGLAIAKELMVAQRGEIRVERAKDRGTVVTLILPTSA